MISSNSVLNKKLHDIKKCGISLEKTFRTDPVKWSMFGWLMLTVIAMMCGIIIGDRGKSLIDTLMLLSSMFFAGALGYQKKLLHGTESILLLAYAVWLTATRLLHGDQSLLQSVERIGMALFAVVVCYAVPFHFTTARSRRKLKLAVAGTTAAFCTLCALLAILIAVFGVNIRLGSALDFSDWIHIIEAGDFKGRLRFAGHSTLIANMICLGVASALYCAMEVRSVWKKAACAAAVIVMLPVLPMTDTRSCSIITAMIIAAAAAMALFDRLRTLPDNKVHPALRIICAALCFGVIFAGSFAYIDGQRDVIEKIGSGAVSSESVTEESEENGLTLSDRGYEDAQEMISFSGRSVIYKQALIELRKDPGVLLFGELYDDSIIVLETRDENGQLPDWSAVHWHNSFIEVLFETGIVGLALIVGFVILVLISMVRIFFGPFVRYSISDKFMLAIPAVALLAGMLEPLLFSILEQYFPKLIYVLFLVWAGIAVSEVIGRREK